MQSPVSYDLLLDQLPGVFSLADLKQNLGEQAEQAMEMTLHWLETGQVRQVAPPRPVFFKTSDPALTEQARCEALLRAFPSVIMVGGSSLWRQGLSRNQDRQLECCVSESDHQCLLPNVRLHWRPADWWEVVRRTGGIAGEHHGIALLAAEVVLADAAVFTDVWMPDQADILWDRVSTSRLSLASEKMRTLTAAQSR